MGSLLEELARREAAARERVERLRGQLAAEEEALSRLVITRETVEEVLGEAAQVVERPAESGMIEFVAELGRREPYALGDLGGVTVAVAGEVTSGRFHGTGLLWNRAHDDFDVPNAYTVVVRRLRCTRQVLLRLGANAFLVTGHEIPTEIGSAGECPAAPTSSSWRRSWPPRDHRLVRSRGGAAIPCCRRCRPSCPRWP
ncbi:MAG: hypothetical protein JWN52_1973 [Actinomycetia bacterium]|nr:hypothetical protein [Actinomycetes bacterium]